MTEELRVQWHPAFCAAIRLELKDDLEYLEYINEFNLNSKPLQIDLLIIKKMQDVVINNKIGRIFRGHNIIEYKSPDDSMNVDTFMKAIGYACLYKANEVYVDDIRLEDITITLVRDRYPYKLFKWLREKGFLIYEKYPGIFYVEKPDCFPVQIIVSKKLSRNEQKWLTLLRNELSEEDIQRTVLQVKSLERKGDIENADAVLKVMMDSNGTLFRNAKGELGMGYEALKQLFAPEFVKVKREAKTQYLFELVQNKYLSLEIGVKESGLSQEEFISKMVEAGYVVPVE